MWAEARKQEKKIRGIMVDHKKRAERRREYYEKIVSTYIIFCIFSGRPGKKLDESSEPRIRLLYVVVLCNYVVLLL